MFCSLCRCVGDIRECRQKICPVGHIACESCDQQLEKCFVCGKIFSSFVSVQLDDLVPRLIFGSLNSVQDQKFQPENSENLKRSFESCEKQVRLPAVLECFKLQEKLPNVMKFYEICEESSGLNLEDENLKLLAEPSEAFQCACKCIQHQSSLHNNRSIHLQTSNHSHESKSTIDADSINEIFINSCMNVDGSETASFVSGTESKASSMVPNYPPKLGTPTMAHRVRLAPIFHVDGRTPLQIEPLNSYEFSLSDFCRDKLPSDCSKKLSRLPVSCPITNCGTQSVPSDVCNHITIDHPQIGVLEVSPGELFNVSLNHRGQSNTMICQRLLLVSDMLTDIGHGAFENLLPVFLMTSKLSVRKAFNCSEGGPGDEKFYIYLVGVYQFPLNYTITLWALPTLIKCMSSSVMLINNPPSSKDIITKAFEISHLELKKLTNDGKIKISCQVLFH